MIGGPLAGVRIVELGGIGPAPYAGMVLADMGADVVKVDRVVGRSPLLPGPSDAEILDRGKRSVLVDLKAEQGRDLVLEMLSRSDALIEGFRPGVTERLGIGPARALAANPALVYGRVTGWGQDGPLASTAGHDIDYIAVAGALGSIGGAKPEIPLNLVADFGGGGMFLVAGILAGIIHARSSGRGTVVDAAMVDGVAHLMSMMHGGLAAGWWEPARASNLLDGAAPFYSVYPTADDEYMAVGALEPQFFAELIRGLSLDHWEGRQHDLDAWPEMRAEFAGAFAARTRSDWMETFASGDACVAPVMSLTEARRHRHLEERRTFVEVAGVSQPAPAPRFLGRDPQLRPPPAPGADTATILGELGYTTEEMSALSSSGVIG